MLNEAQMRARLAAAVKAAGSHGRFAAQAGVTQSWVSKALRGGPPGPKMLRAIGLASEPSYRELQP